MTSIRCVVVGDGGVGKTCLLIRYTNNYFPGEYIPTVFDNYASNLMVKGEMVCLTLIDTAGQEEYEALRINSYLDADVILICFSISNPTSLNRAIKVWAPEVRDNCPTCSVILVGTQVDLRQQNFDGRTVTPAQGHAAQQQIGASRYIECSALTNDGVQTVFEESIQVVVQKRRSKSIKRRRKTKCSLL